MREEKRREGNTTLLTNRLSFKLLIVLLSLILSFSISCSNEDKTGGADNGDAGGEIFNGGDSNSGKENGDSVKTKHELEGTWVGYDEKDKNYKIKFTVDNDGNIIFYPKPALDNDDLPLTYSYRGKVETNAIVYPYTVKISNGYIDYIDEEDKENRVFTFSNSSSCTAIYTRLEGLKNDYPTLTGGVTVEFTKQ